MLRFLQFPFIEDLPDDFVATHAESGIHKVVHSAEVSIETIAQIRETDGAVGVPVHLGKEGADGGKLFHIGQSRE